MTLSCPKCAKRHQATDAEPGSVLKCVACGAAIPVPDRATMPDTAGPTGVDRPERGIPTSPRAVPGLPTTVPVAQEPTSDAEDDLARDLAELPTARGSMQQAEEPIPSKIGRYPVLGVIGRGGMGLVYRAKSDTRALVEARRSRARRLSLAGLLALVVVASLAVWWRSRRPSPDPPLAIRTPEVDNGARSIEQAELEVRAAVRWLGKTARPLEVPSKEVSGEGRMESFIEVFGDLASLEREWVAYIAELKLD